MDDYKYLIGKDNYKLSRILERALYWKRMAESYIEGIGMKEQTIIDTICISNMVCCYFSDIIRLKEFHPVDTTNRIKVIAYGVFWFIRTGPIQLTDDVSNEQIFINQKIAVHVIMSEFFRDFQTPEDEEAHLNLAKELLYCFKYRFYTPQSIELAIYSYLVGAEAINIIH